MNKRPILYGAEEREFTSNGIGFLSDAMSVTVTEELNGQYELEMIYPVGGRYFSELDYRKIILAKPSGAQGEQPFRIYRITKPMDGRVTVCARHISYDLGGIPVSPFEADTVAGALSYISVLSYGENPFRFYTDKATVADMKLPFPRSARACLLGTEGSVLDVYGGEYQFDMYSVRLLKKRGEDRGFTVAYGVNLTDMKQEQNCADTYTGIYPYWYDSDVEKLVSLPEKTVNAEGEFGYTKIKTVDLTSYFEKQPTEAELRDAAKQYVKDNDIGVPIISLDVKFELLRQSEEYGGFEFLEDAELGDTVRIRFERLGIYAEARCTRTVYDALSFKYKSISVGSIRTGVTSKIVTLENTVKQSTRLLGGAIASVARIEAATEDNSAKISMIVTSSDGNNVVEGSVLVEAINGQSAVKIGADKVAIDVVDELNASAKTVKINSNRLIVDSDNFKLSADGTFSASNGNFSTKNGDNKTLIASGEIVTTNITGSSSLTLHGSSAWFSNAAGTEYSYIEWQEQRSFGNTYHCPIFRGKWFFDMSEFRSLIFGKKQTPYAMFGIRTEYDNAFSIETDRDGVNWAPMLLNASTARNNIIFGSWEFRDGEPSYGSDRNIKKNIRELDGRYSNFFDRLSPKAFEYVNGNSGRTHVGLIAQEAYEALNVAGLTSQDFAGICIRDAGKETELWTVRVGEFLGLCIDEIQKLKKRVSELEAKGNEKR